MTTTPKSTGVIENSRGTAPANTKASTPRPTKVRVAIRERSGARPVVTNTMA